MAFSLDIPSFEPHTALVIILTSPTESNLKDLKVDLESNFLSPSPEFEKVIYVASNKVEDESSTDRPRGKLFGSNRPRRWR